MSEIARYLGHKDSRITERVYARFSPEHLRAASKSLEVGEFTQKRLAKRSPRMSGTGVEKALELANILLAAPRLFSGQLAEVAIIGRGRSLQLKSLGVDFSLLDILAKAMGTPAEAKRRAR